MDRKFAPIALVSLLLVLLIFSGCTSNKFVPCCQKKFIYNVTNKSFMPGGDFACVYPNNSLFGRCYRDATMGNFSKGVAICTDDTTTCDSIENDRDCDEKANCYWNASPLASPHCQGAGLAEFVMPICVDDIPSNCINNRCTAMMCGYTDFSASPPPSSQDWNPDAPAGTQSALPEQEISTLPKINLQGTMCEFKSMNRKLYDQVTKSKGSLWVNAFRFGVGTSFSDFEQARNFFPATDRVCNINPMGSIDRFTVYLNMPDTFCQESFSNYYHCSLYDMNFTDLSVCTMYCNGLNQTTTPTDCASVYVQPQYLCAADSFAYSDKETCSGRCGIMSDPSLCTKDDTVAPFLQSDARFVTKYTADYWVNSADPMDCSTRSNEFEQTCLQHGGAGDYPDRKFCYDWYAGQEHYWCDDFWPVGAKGANIKSGPWYSWQGTGNFHTYFENRKQGEVDFDYEYYAWKLKNQSLEAGLNVSKPFPYECKDSTQCLSGVCDSTYSKRSLCKTSATDTLDCGCRVERVGQYQTLTLLCDTYGPMPLIAETDAIFNYNHIAEFASSEIFTASQEYYRNPGSRVEFHYYAPVGQRPKFFDECGVPVTATPVQKCVYYDVDFTGLFTFDLYPVITDIAATASECPDFATGDSNPANPVLYDFYNITFDMSTPTLGTQCLLTQQKIDPPYVDIQNLGWCAGCTYATMAVQKIDWGPVTGSTIGPGDEWAGGWGYGCLEWRGEFNYTVADGSGRSLKTNYLTGKEDASVSEVRKYKDGDPLNGNLERSSWDDEEDFHYECTDGWGMGPYGWWSAGSVSHPSPPYLRDKLTSYLQSNVMPILDERSSSTGLLRGTVTVLPECTQGSVDIYYCDGDMSERYYESTCGGWLSCWSGCERGYTCVGGTNDGQEFASFNDCDPLGPSTNCPSGTCTPTTDTSGWVCNTNDEYYLTENQCWNGVWGGMAWTSLDGCEAFRYQTPIGATYKPTEICNGFGEGAAIHVIGDTNLLTASGWQGEAGISPVDEGDLAQYLMGGDRADANEMIIPRTDYSGKISWTDSYYALNGTAAINVRANAMKKQCRTPPLVAIAINGYSDTATTSDVTRLRDLIGGTAIPGVLHRFFFKPEWNEVYTGGGGTYEQMVFRGTPNKYADNVDLLLQEWYPSCNAALPIGERVAREVDGRMAFSRALLSNFSKPSLIWKFHFPDASCGQNIGGKADYSVFLDYLFNNTGNMVDSGIIGLIYDSWMTETGQGYGAPTRTETSNFNALCPLLSGSSEIIDIYTELTLQQAAGRLDDAATGKSTSPFCELQKYSKAVLGITKYTYGQKLYAQNRTCKCVPCTKSDYGMGTCREDDVGIMYDGVPTNYANDFLPDQMFCNDGTKCAFPDLTWSNYSKYRCPANCVNATACTVCGDPSFAGATSFCRIEQSGESPIVANMDYNALATETAANNYWEFIAGLPAKDKCCVEKQEPDQPLLKYTFVSHPASKQRSEFIQYPTRGEIGLDCGRTPDTSVLKYCGVRIPISEKEIQCFRVG